MNLFEAAVKFTTKGQAEVKTGIDSVAGSLEGLKSKINLVLGVLAGGALFKEVISDSVELAEHFAILSEKTGETVENLSRLAYAAKISNVEMGSLDGALKKLALSMQGVNLETGNAVKAFDAMGVRVHNTDGTLRTQVDVLLDVAEKFKGYEDGAAKAALAMDIFGRAGSDMIPLLNRGRDGIKELTDESDRLGVTLSKQDQEILSRYEETLKRVHAVLGALGRAIAVAVVQPLENLGRAFVGTAGSAEVMHRAADYTARVMAFLANVIIEVKIALQGFIELVKIAAAFVSGGLDSAVKQARQSASDLTDAQDSAANAIVKNRLIMMGYKHAVEETSKAVDELSGKKAAPLIEKPGEDQVAAAAKKYSEETDKLFEQAFLRRMERKEREEEELKESERRIQEAIRSYNEETDRIMEAQFNARMERIANEQREIATNIATAFQSAFQAAFSGGGVVSAIKAFGASILAAFGDILVRMGTAALAAAPLIESIRRALMSLSGAGLVFGGLALVAVGATLGAAARSIGSAGFSGGSSPGIAQQGTNPFQDNWTRVIFGTNSAATAAGVVPQQPITVTVIGPNDPTAQRQITELIKNAGRR